ncbi:sirohydrochlorin cobaltochelatase [Marinilabilia salmonicolor]|jgi:sirohydrochlorin cobaltochelatase|uniref:Sirohydrochlorin cobaltochelatase n=1 Tax=Marinilabilia salmonicolor TaxID=989 RepID=A0A2T0XBA8_9BACT|nr:sirohydrochlorin cobaltochelatase [Marinilabilia salmonicolor]PRY96221.1 sirohydrochlorin cobaltochelatase [Marinilabilia salmonicolor]RCW35315.1 sirohydrochlorin cobaltochelatase [Marinilabilia salmonicolor]
MKNLLLIGLFAIIFFNMGTNAQTKTGKKGILLITFGTSYPEARKAFENIEQKVKTHWPDVDIYWAYTSGFIRKKLAKQGIQMDSPSEALAKIGEAGYTLVAAQSLHIIPGAEFHDVVHTVKGFSLVQKGVGKTNMGRPLVSNHEDLQRMARFFTQQLPVSDDEAVVLMGHGTHHDANIYYPGFQYYLNDLSDRHYVATVEGYPSLDNVIKQLKKEHIQKVTLTPFMSVAGDHAQNDMAGEEKESWKSQLEAEGFEVDVVMKGLAEYDEVVMIWIDHLKEAFDEL